MGEISKHKTINAPVQAVFNYISDPRNAPSFINSINRIVSGPEGTPSQGQVWRAEATLLGKQSVINLRLARLDPPHAVTFSIDGDPHGILSLRLSPDEGAQSRTRVAINLDVPKVPSIFLGAIMGNLLEGDMQRLKDRLEA